MLTLSSQQSNTYTFGNSADPDEMALNEPSHQDLYCLQFCYSFLTETETLFETDLTDLPKFRKGRVHVKNSGVKWLNKNTLSCIGAWTLNDI